MYEKLEECPSCKHTKFSNHSICKDHTVSGESFALIKCDKCGLIFTNPRPDQQNIGKYYADESYISHTNKANTPLNLAYKFVRTITLNQKLTLIKKYTKAQSLLDFGCGSGVFLDFMKTKHYQIEGLETHTDTALNAEQLTKATIYQHLSNIQKDKYDIITAWHVIEHVHELKLTLNTLRKALKKDGYLFIAVPNHLSHDATHYKENWAAYDVPKHLYHFDKASFKTLAKNCKLQVINIHPMKFDSFYVSMLSEKNKTGTSNILSALRIGQQSNKIAEQNGEYSSLIYVLKA